MQIPAQWICHLSGNSNHFAFRGVEALPEANHIVNWTGSNLVLECSITADYVSAVANWFYTVHSQVFLTLDNHWRTKKWNISGTAVSHKPVLVFHFEKGKCGDLTISVELFFTASVVQKAASVQVVNLHLALTGPFECNGQMQVVRSQRGRADLGLMFKIMMQVYLLTIILSLQRVWLFTLPCLEWPAADERVYIKSENFSRRA